MSCVDKEVIIASPAGVFIEWDQVLQKRGSLLFSVVKLAADKNSGAFNDIWSSPLTETSVC